VGGLKNNKQTISSKQIKAL